MASTVFVLGAHRHRDYYRMKSGGAGQVRRGPQKLPDSEENFVFERLLSLRTRDSAVYEGLYALQIKSGAADWRTGE